MTKVRLEYDGISRGTYQNQIALAYLSYRNEQGICDHKGNYIHHYPEPKTAEAKAIKQHIKTGIIPLLEKDLNKLGYNPNAVVVENQNPYPLIQIVRKDGHSITDGDIQKIERSIKKSLQFHAFVEDKREAANRGCFETHGFFANEPRNRNKTNHPTTRRAKRMP